MDNHSDRKALGAGAADRRRGRLIAKIIGTLALVSFMLVATASTARALGIGEIVDESPLGPVVETVEDVAEPVTDLIEEPVGQSVEPVTEAVEPVTDVATEPVAELVSPVVETVEEVAEPVTESVEEVTEVVEPVVGAVEEVTEPVTGTVEGVVGPVTEVVEGPVRSVTGTVGSVLEEVREPIQPVIDVIDETIEGTTGVVGGVTTPVVEGVDELIDPVLPSIPAPGVGDDPDHGGSISDPGPVRGPDSPDTPSNPPGSRAHLPDPPLARPVLVPVPSLLTTPPPAVGAGQASDEGASLRESPPTSTLMADAVRGGDSPGGVGPPEGTGPSPRSLALPTATVSSSGSGPALGLLAVLVLLGLIAPRLSRWLRPRPVIWRPYALAEALELPG